jgi:hypothetical protein
MCGQFLDYLFFKLVYLLAFMTVLTCFGYFSFVVGFEVRFLDASIFVLFIQYYFGQYESFVVPDEF